MTLLANLLMTPNQEEQLIPEPRNLSRMGNEHDRNVIQCSGGKGKVPHLGRNKPMLPLYVRTTQLCGKVVDTKLTTCSSVPLQ